MSFSIMTQCVPGMHSTCAFVNTNSQFTFTAPAHNVDTVDCRRVIGHTVSSPYLSAPSSLIIETVPLLWYVLFFSGIVHFTGLHSDDHLGQMEAQSLQQGVQGLSQPSDGHYSPDSLTVVEIVFYIYIL